MSSTVYIFSGGQKRSLLTSLERGTQVRKFATLYSKKYDTWMIIFQDDYEAEWYVQIDDVGDQAVAKSVADALNRAQKES